MKRRGRYKEIEKELFQIISTGNWTLEKNLVSAEIGLKRKNLGCFHQSRIQFSGKSWSCSWPLTGPILDPGRDVRGFK